MRNRAPARDLFRRRPAAILGIAAVLGLCPTARAAEEHSWTVRLEPMYMSVFGHDPHVLTIRESDLDAMPPMVSSRIIEHDTESGFQFRAGFQYTGERWGWGVDLFVFAAAQDAGNFTAAAEGPGGTIDAVSFQAADRQYLSSDPSEVLFYTVREDNDLEVWTADVFGATSLTDRQNSDLRLRFGLRAGDFDNDYRAVLGIEDAAGSFLDSSSNYNLMLGPMVGLDGEIRHGRNRVRGFLGQSVLLGSTSVGGTTRDFTGPVSMPVLTGQEVFRRERDVAVPITEFRVSWTYDVSRTVALGVGANTSVWWDVPVPPGVEPGHGGDDGFRESTIVFYGLAGIVELTF